MLLITTASSASYRTAPRTYWRSALRHETTLDFFFFFARHDFLLDVYLSFAQIKTDVETKGDFINGLINKVQTTTYTDVEQVLTFVDWLDQQLSTLVIKQTQLYLVPFVVFTSTSARTAAGMVGEVVTDQT